MKITALTLGTHQIEQTLAFYTEVLELPIAQQTASTVSFQVGSTLLTFAETPVDRPVYHFAFTIPQNQLEAAIAWANTRLELIKNQADQVVTQFESWNASSIYFYDNNRNLLEFIVRRDLNNPSTAEFHPRNITSISEIGIVTPKPITLAENWMQKYDLSYFDKSPVSEDFLAMGDDEGLLIVVSPERNWYPTTEKAQYFAADIALENNDKSLKITY